MLSCDCSRNASLHLPVNIISFVMTAAYASAYAYAYASHHILSWSLSLKSVALSCAPIRALLRTHGLKSTHAMLRRWERSCGSTPVGALPWVQPALCASVWLNFVLICNIGDGLLDYTKVIAYLATHSQTNYLPISTKLMTFSNSSTSRTNIFISSAMLDCSITSLCDGTKSTGATFLCSKKTWSAPVGTTVALRIPAQLWRK